MNSRSCFGELEPLKAKRAESLDSIRPGDRMRAIASAMELYFTFEDWLKEQRRQLFWLTGLGRSGKLPRRPF